MKVFDKVFVVTGAGGGIGRELVVQLLNKGACVAAVINKSGLHETQSLSKEYGNKITTHIANLVSRDEVEKLPKEIIAKHGRIDGIINNAGIVQPFINVNELDFERIELVMNVNFYGTLYMCKAFLPHLLERPEAHIANISSMGGFLPVPRQSIYCASKAAVKLFTECLHSELANTNVGVTLVLPGGVSTNILQGSGVKREKLQDSYFKLLTPNEAASIIIRGIENNRYRVLAGKDSKIMDFLYRFNPKKAAKLIAEKLK